MTPYITEKNRQPLTDLQKLENWLGSYAPTAYAVERGRVISIGDGVAWIEGLPSARVDELLDFTDGSVGMVFDLRENLVGAIILKQTEQLTAGIEVHRTARPLGLTASDELLGRVIGPLGNPLDDKPAVQQGAWLPLETQTPKIHQRDFVHKPLYSGIRLIDSMIPIGRGQRQLIIGDEGTGRSVIALNTLLQQKDENIRCIYVLIGQKRTAAIQLLETLRASGADQYTTVIVADGGELAGLQYLAPFAGCALAAHWMWQGHHTLVIYDDLATHARSYRELSLLLRRPPGREAYPGDVFSVHAQLLEQATCLAPELGGGSMTALPIAETQQGEISAYIPTNLISITDGQIYLDKGLFAGGFRPAIDVGKSVSRIGGKAQHPALRQEAGRMKLDYARFLELEVFTRFGAKLEPAMQQVIHRGQLLREILKQDRLERSSPSQQLAWMLAFNEGLFDALQPQQVQAQLQQLWALVAELPLDLDSPKDQWLASVQQVLQVSSC